MSTDVWYQRFGSPKAWGYQVRLSVDEPCPTITTKAFSNVGVPSEWYLCWNPAMATPLQTEKPIYRVPTMVEVSQVPSNGLSMVSTFSGCGGSCLGFRMLGFRTLWASEFVPAAQEVYRRNHPTVPLDTRDIRTVLPEDILDRIGLARGEVDVLEGSPPCAAFSSAGDRHRTWGKQRKYSGTVQQTDDLFGEYARLLTGLQPRMFVAENVSGLVKGVAKGFFLDILRMLEDCGYRVEARLLDASWLGVPQARQRLIFQGIRSDLPGTVRWPTPLGFRYTVRDALPHITNEGRKSEHVARRHFRIEEIKALSSFPDDFILTGSLNQQWERLGRAVPPLMMRSVAECVRDTLTDIG